jgi:hypothetical protein
MIITKLIIGVIIATLVLPTTIHVSATQDKPEETQRCVGDEETGFYREDGFPIATKDRPATNPDFAPDRNCDLVWELKCISGSEQKCSDLRGYDNGEKIVRQKFNELLKLNTRIAERHMGMTWGLS